MNVYAQTTTQTGAIVRRRTIREWIEANLRTLNIVSLTLVGILCLSYILQVTNTVARGYELRDLEVQIQDLTLQNEILSVQARQAQSLEHVSKSVKMLGFIEAGQPTYVDSGEPSYALAD